VKRIQIVKETTEVAAKILKHNDFILSDDMTAGQIKGWDSLTHMEIIVALEKHFKTKISFSDLMIMNNMGDLFSLLESRLD
jgi:acyl carrier protein